jgi:large subunit GTPase 1
VVVAGCQDWLKGVGAKFFMKTTYQWGRALIRDRGREPEREKRKSLKSSLESSNIDAVIESAEVLGINLRRPREVQVGGAREAREVEPGRGAEGKVEEESEVGIVPRKPDPGLPKDIYAVRERKMFNQWKNKMNTLLSEGRRLTPYERNIHVWRQLWTTAEISSLLIQIVDARNPDLFYTPEIEWGYKGKRHLLLLNKADLLSAWQVGEWKRSLEARGIEHLFYSAKGVNHERKGVSGWRDLLKKIEAVRDEMGSEDFIVGMVGYPNVGKSSTINDLFGKKVVTTSLMPGKTKSIQTLELFREGMKKKISVCDCPGLVFPNFVGEKEDLILNGILSLDQSKEIKACLELLVRRVGVPTLCAIYGVNSFVNDSRNSLHDNFIACFMKTKGHLEEGKAIKRLVKDHLEGKTLFAHPPADYAEGDPERNERFNRESRREAKGVSLETNHEWYRESTGSGYTVRGAHKFSRHYQEEMFSKKHYQRKGKNRVQPKWSA